MQTQRRQLLDKISSTQNTWTYQIELDLPLLGEIPLLKDLGLSRLPILGSVHLSDAVLYTFGTIPPLLSRNTRNIMGTIISFANTLDPNNHGFKDIPHWPTYGYNSKNLYQFEETGPVVINDDFREDAMRYINDNADTFVI
jgi:acetylcholinesterase